MYRCYNCNSDRVSWKQNFSTEDFGLEFEGVASRFVCLDCGARILCIVPSDMQADDEQTEDAQLEGQMSLEDYLG